MQPKIKTISKGHGKVRKVVVPSPLRKRLCREGIPALLRLMRKSCDLRVVHGFAPLRSPVTNAQRHIGYAYTVCFDLADFFNHVTLQRVGSQLRGRSVLTFGIPVWQAFFVRGIAMQGLPSSPALANIAASGMDRRILKECDHLKRLGLGRVVYTRYADDLSISCDTPEAVDRILERVPVIATEVGFKVNHQKTKVLCAKRGRRIICGVAVGQKGIYPTRETKRRLRAARHNAKIGRAKPFPAKQWSRYSRLCRHYGQKRMAKGRWVGRWLAQRVRGLEEWARLKMPGAGKRSAGRIPKVDGTTAADSLQELAEREAWRCQA